MKKHLTLLLLLLTFFAAKAQESNENQTVSGVIFNTEDDAAMGNVSILNLNQVTGRVSNDKGEFSIPAKVNDTLYFSFLGFKPIKIRVTNDLINIKNNRIGLTELAYALNEVTVSPFIITGYLDIDAKNVPINNAYKYRIPGLNTGYEAGNARPGALSNVLGAIFNPADLLYKVFGKRPRQMRKLEKIKQDDQIRNLLATKVDRETLSALLQVSKDDIDDILRSCNFSDDFIKNSNDLQILDAISNCYEDYKVLNRQ
ncbi:carboxypeptidase-like regulatory domain-containing protein [Zhouia sp. PK063]|uniref:carboxypeptidase-like regulatory domain-containing protein n=1 Tax=Zhouia sp. PK063 TaxID=3373602 RepID=UPI003792D868